MGFFSRFFSSPKETVKEKVILEPFKPHTAVAVSNKYVELGLNRPMDTEERDLVAAMTSVIVAGDRPESNFHIKEVTAIDENKLVAVMAVSGLLAGDTKRPQSDFVLRSVKEKTN